MAGPKATAGEDPSRYLLYGLGVTNRAVARALLTRGATVVVADDQPTVERRREAAELGIELRGPLDDDELAMLVAESDVVVPAPGLPERHRVVIAAEGAGVPVLSEFDLAGRWDSRPVISITGTNGKTTVTTLVTLMFERSGLRAAAVGNTEVPLVEALGDPAIEVFVVEASSFRLSRTVRYVPLVATWLNFAPDHLDVHDDLYAYEAAKARQWADLDASSTAVANAEDDVVVRHLGLGGARFVTYGLDPASARLGYDHYTVIDGSLVTPSGDVIVATTELFRSMPHDVSNALAASATALAAGATLWGVRAALREFPGLSHRVEFVGEGDGVRWYDDSKATAPHAVVAAVSGFDRVVLIAGGRNKGLDLSVLADLAERVVGVVGIGEAGPDVVAAFAGGDVPTHVAESMRDAVGAAAAMAGAGDAVLLSPGCASFDWYGSYAERGDDFAAEVRRRIGVAG